MLVTIKRTVGLPKFSFRGEVKNSGNFEIVFGEYEGNTFPSDENPSIIGFKGVAGRRGTHIGYKLDTIVIKLMQKDYTKALRGNFTPDLYAGRHVIFIYTFFNIIEYQYVGDAKAPLLRVIDSKQRLKNGGVYELEPTQIVFSISDHKNVLQIRFNQFL